MILQHETSSLASDLTEVPLLCPFAFERIARFLEGSETQNLAIVTSHAFGGSAAPHSSSVSEPSSPAGDPQPSSHRCGCRNASRLWVRGVILGCCARGGPAAQGLAGGSLFGAIPQV